MKPLIASILLLAGILTGANAQFGFGGPSSEKSLFAESTTIAPGQKFRVALQLDHPDHWHSYYKNDGIGISEVPAIEWNLPDGFSASELTFPAPKEVEYLGYNTYSYGYTNYFLTEITAPENLEVGTEVTLKAAATWQICDDKSCSPEDAEFDLKLAVGDSPVANPQFGPVEEYIVEKVPSKELPEGWTVEAREEGDKIIIKIVGELADDLHFYEYDKQIDAQKPRTVEVIDGGVELVGIRNQGNELSPEAPPALPGVRGILYSKNDFPGTDRHAFWIDTKFGSGGVGSDSKAGSGEGAKAGDQAAEGGEMGTLLVFLFLILGGLILNLMPCVFPVVGLKIMGFVHQAGEDKAKIKLHGIAFTVGVLLSFLALAAFLYPIRGENSLGAQMKEPWVVFVLIIIFLLLALSMSGVFEIGARATSVGSKLTSKEGVSGSFFSGVLAVIVATPCSAPFLGPAIGAAWKFDGILFFLALLAMGVGLALPYIVLSFFPQLVNKLPSPGPWMESFKQGMAFLLYGSVGYLLWVYSGQIGEEGQKGLWVMLGVTIIAFAAWIYGRWGAPHRTKKTRLIGYAVAVVALGYGVILAKPLPKPSAAEVANAVPKFDWGKWTPDKVKELVAAGKPVYVDFTARWCLTCQTNKAAAYTDEVRQLFYDKGIVTLKADMTVSDPLADQAIHELGRAAIPVNVLYVPGDDTPHVTREVLTPGYMIDLVNQHLGDQVAQAGG